MRSAALAVLAVVLAVSLHAAQQIDPAEIQLQAAINKATVEGDLKGAIIDLQRILNTAGVSRSVAARALLHLGECHEKLGTAEARRSYERVLKDYADQGDVVRQAKERLATLAKTGAAHTEDVLQGRRVLGPFEHLWVAASPDGRYVAYCCGPRDPFPLVVHDTANGQDQEFAITPDTGMRGGAPAFSPDSEAIAYVSEPEDEAPDLRVVKRTAPGNQVLFKSADVSNIAVFGWMPDGKDLLVRLTHKDKSTELALVPAAGGSPRTVRSPSPYTGDLERGHLSPDGKYLAYRAQAAGAGGAWTTRVSALDGSLDAVLVEHPANDWNIGWTADGRFAFYSTERGSEGIWAVKVAGGKAQGLPERVAGKVDDSIEPVGVTREGAFFYHKDVLDFQIHLMSVTPASGALRTSRVLSGALSPDWSPDGRFLAYSQMHTGLVTIQTLATGATRTLWTGLPGVLMALKWYPDHTALAAQGVGPDESWASLGLRRVDLASGSLSDIVLGRNWDEFGANPTFSADGKLLFYKAYDAARQVSTLTQYNLETHVKETLLERKAPQYVGAFSVLPRTGQIAAAVQELNGPSSLGLLDPSSHELRVIHRTPKGDFIPTCVSLAWMPDGKSLLFVTSRWTKGSPWSLHRIPVSGGQPEKLFEAELIWQVRVHPDGTQVAVETRSYKGETLVVDNLFAAARRQRPD